MSRSMIPRSDNELLFFLTLKTMTLVTWKMISTSRQESTPPNPAQPTIYLSQATTANNSSNLSPPSSATLHSSCSSTHAFSPCSHPAQSTNPLPFNSNHFHHAQTQLRQQLNSPLFSNQFHPISTQLNKSFLWFTLSLLYPTRQVFLFSANNSIPCPTQQSTTAKYSSISITIY